MSGNNWKILDYNNVLSKAKKHNVKSGSWTQLDSDGLDNLV